MRSMASGEIVFRPLRPSRSDVDCGTPSIMVRKVRPRRVNP